MFLVGVVYCISVFFALSDFPPPSYMRMRYESNFRKNENKFYSLTTYFDSILLKNNNTWSVTFGLTRKRTSIYIILYPNYGSVSSINPILGAKDMKLDDPALDTILSKLGWTKGVLLELKSRLSAVNCSFITNNPNNKRPIEIYDAPRDMEGHFMYRIFPESLSDTLKRIHGYPLGGSTFGDRVVLSY